MPCPSRFTCRNDLDKEKRVNRTFCDCVRISSGMLQLLGCYQFCVCLCYVHVWIEACCEVPKKRSTSYV